TDAHGDSRGDRETTVGVAAVTARTLGACATRGRTSGRRAGVTTRTRSDRAALPTVGDTTLAAGRGPTSSARAGTARAAGSTRAATRAGTGGTTRGLRGTTRRITRSEIATHGGRRTSALAIGSTGSGARPTSGRGSATIRLTERASLRVTSRTTRTTHTASTARTTRTTRAASTTGRASGSDCARATRSTGSRATVTALGSAR